MIRRVFRLFVLSGVAAAAVAVYRSMTRTDDALPAPAAAPSAPWPPLQAEPVTTPTPSASPAADTTTPPATSTPDNAVSDTTVADVPVAPESAAAEPSWAEPTADGQCPPGFPIKAKLSSKIFHAPGQLNYDRTTPDRCYRDEVAAVADGLRAAKR